MLNTRPNMPSYDNFYEALISAHQDLSTEDSHAMNARLVLLLCNHIGDAAILKEAFTLARGKANSTAHSTASLAGHPAITQVGVKLD